MKATRLFSVTLLPGGQCTWNCAPGREILDIKHGRFISRLEINNASLGTRQYIIDRFDDGSLKFTDGIFCHWKYTDRPLLPDPEFDLDEIHQGQDLVKAGAHLDRSERS